MKGLDYYTLNKAFDLLLYDVDMSGIDENVFERVYNIICDGKCNENQDCKKCIKEYYIKQAKED